MQAIRYEGIYFILSTNIIVVLFKMKVLRLISVLPNKPGQNVYKNINHISSAVSSMSWSRTISIPRLFQNFNADRQIEQSMSLLAIILVLSITHKGVDNDSATIKHKLR